MKITVLSGPDRNSNYGDCFILDDGNDLVVYDCGSEVLANEVISYMSKNGYQKAVAILSHNDADHFDGIQYLINKGRIEVVYTVDFLSHIDDIIKKCDGRKTYNSIRKQLEDKYDKITKIKEYIVDIYPLNKNITKNICIVGPDINYMINAVIHQLDNSEGDTVDRETIVNATSVQVRVTLNNGVRVLLCGDCSFAAIESKINGYNIIQLPHHGKDIQANDIFKFVTDINNKLFIVSDNTGDSNGGSDERVFKGKCVLNTKSNGTFYIDETTLDDRTAYVSGKSLGNTI